MRAQVQVDRFLDSLHRFLRSVTLRAATLQFKNIGEIPVAVLFNDDLGRAAVQGK